MNETEYRSYKAKLCDAVRHKDFDLANAIRLLILYFYKPFDGRRRVNSIQDLPKDPCTLNGQ